MRRAAGDALRASPLVPPTRPPSDVFPIRTAKLGPVAPPVPRFRPDLALHPSGEPTPSPAPRGPIGDSGRVKSEEGPDLSVTRCTNPTATSLKISPTPRISLAAGTTPPACCPDSAPPSPPAYIPPSLDDGLSGCSSAACFPTLAPRRSRLGLPRPRPSGVRPFASPAMDSDEEEEQMFVELMQEEMAAAAQDDEHMMILGCLASMYAGLATSRHCGSALGRRKCKPRQRMEGYCMLYADYFADNPLHGNVQGSQKGCTVILEAVATHDLWIWHSFFGMPGSNNDINVLNCSPVFSKLVEGHAPPVDYVINGRHYNKGYYLADGIYPKWATFVKTISNPSTPKLCEFVKKQEACRKDVKRAFGVLQQRFAVVRFPAMTWSKDQR
ncbi:hypothetical protein QYE76_009885 [Lolium multiflorum]|uniref:Protein ALP1-like n=1 Tax=Lolium multiflorum TaxID=4521 RepID=A0AAD8TVV7_LOLMU|nr:hypothetical protein QYE76_009885 [Lolium multiflorum]